VKFGIITSIDSEKGIGIVASSGMDMLDLHFFLDDKHPVKEGDSVQYQSGEFAAVVRLASDENKNMPIVDSGGRKTAVDSTGEKVDI
jgi:hypothetical protein